MATSSTNEGKSPGQSVEAGKTGSDAGKPTP